MRTFRYTKIEEQLALRIAERIICIEQKSQQDAILQNAPEFLRPLIKGLVSSSELIQNREIAKRIANLKGIEARNAALAKISFASQESIKRMATAIFFKNRHPL